MLLLLSNPPLSAQGDITQYQMSCAEVVFVTGTIDQPLSGYAPTVTMNLAGPVFNNVAVYAPEATNAINTGYTMGRDLTYGVVNMRTTQDEDVGWEGLLPFNCLYTFQSGRTPGHIGWGEYKFTVEIAGEEKSFYLSTLDGNWLSPVLGDDNKIVFYLDFHANPIEIDIQVYQYSTQNWRSVAGDERVTFWELHDASRNRDHLVALSNTPFTIDGGGDGFIEVPFTNSHHEFDINVYIDEVTEIQIPVGKTVTITDYEYQEGENTLYETSTWRFDQMTGIVVAGGDLNVRSKDPLIASRAVPRWAVHLLGITPNLMTPQVRWGGIRCIDGGGLSLIDMHIRYASSGVNLIQGFAEIRRSWIDSCMTGISNFRGKLIARRDTITNCNVGVDFSDARIWTARLASLIDSCQIFRSVRDGIRLSRYSPSLPSESFNVAHPEHSLIIRHSEIKYSGGHGINAAYASAAIRNCNISKNGWLWGTPLSSISDDYSGNAGVFGSNRSIFNIHGSDFQSNVGPGIHLTGLETEGTGIARTTAYDAADIRGWNCFDGNKFSMLLENKCDAYFGWRTDGVDAYINDLNALRNPRWRNPADQEYINVLVRGAGTVQLDHNFWLPSGISSILIEGGVGSFSAMYPAASADVRCGEGGAQPGSGTIENNSGQTASNLVRLVKNDSLRAAWELLKANISDNLSSEDARVFAWALQTLRLSGGVDSAQIMLEQEGFSPDDGTVSSLDNYSLLSLRAIYVLLDDSTSAWRVYDTLMARVQWETDEFDSLAVEQYKLDLLWYLNKDTTEAQTLVTALYNQYPGSPEIRTMYVDITNDTTAYWNGVFEEMEKTSERAISVAVPENLLILDCSPNPFNPSTTLRFRLLRESAVRLTVLTPTGAVADVRSLGSFAAGVHAIEYNALGLASGSYTAVLTDGIATSTIRMVLMK
jgi:hypothetical protein